MTIVLVAIIKSIDMHHLLLFSDTILIVECGLI
jgi:hypothetical protein